MVLFLFYYSRINNIFQDINKVHKPNISLTQEEVLDALQKEKTGNNNSENKDEGIKI